MNITRRDFISSLIACGATAAFGLPKAEKQFEDIRVDRYYMLQGWEYKDTGGEGMPGYAWAPSLLESMRHWDHCRELDDKLQLVEDRGFYFTPSQYFGGEHKQYERIYLTKEWMMEFYRRHKYDTAELWEKRYHKYLDDVHSGAYRQDNYIY